MFNFLVLWILLLIPLTISCTEIPVIGLLTLPCQYQADACPSNATSEFEPASYVKSDYVNYIQSGGAIVVPLLSDSNNFSHISQILPYLNGVFFTGGGAALNTNDTWYNTATNIMDYIVANTSSDDEINTTPLWGTCLGFETIINYIAKKNVLFDTDSENVPLSLKFNNNNVISSRMFNNSFGYSNVILDILSNPQNKYTVNLHNYGVSPNTWKDNKYLNDSVKILATSVDLKNQTFVALIETNTNFSNIRWYASQFHSEIVLFETMDTIDGYTTKIERNFQSIVANSYFTQFFVNECRKWNNNTMSQNDIAKYSIGNFPNAMIGTDYIFPNSSYVKNYFFNRNRNNM